MAISRQTATGKQKTQITLYSAAMATCLFAAAPTSAQTVIIGGGNDRPVVVNYPPAYSPAYPQARQPVTQGVAIPSQNGVDYSKGARIEAGDEVIVLTPPSQQKKRPAKVVRPAKKKPIKVETASQEPKTVSEDVVKAEPVQKEEPKKVVQAEKPTAKPTPVAKETDTKPAEDKMAAPEPKVTVAETPKTKPAPEPKAAKPEPEVTKQEMAEVKETSPEVESTEKVEETTAEPKGPKQIAPVKVEEPTENKEQQVAALAPESDISKKTNKIPEIKPEVDKQTQTLMFEKEETNLPNTAAPVLEKISKQVSENQDRVQIIAYADAASNGRARRISLGRALSIRTKLMELGVPNNRIEVRALGLPTDDAPADRVELKIITR